MSGVTEEMVEKAAEEIHNLRYPVMVAATQEIPRTWAEVVAKEPYHRAYVQRIRDDARAALAAVVPLIEAREREACANMLIGIAEVHHLAANVLQDEKMMVSAEIREVEAVAFEAAAAAIRARTGETP